MENQSAINKTDQASIRSAGKVSLGTMSSRLLGLVREQVFAYLFGAGMAADAFIAAFRVPNLLRDMFAEGALSAAFIPTFTEKLTKEGRSSAFNIASIVLSFLLVVVSLVVIAGIIFAPHIVNEIAGGFEDIEGKISLTTTLARIMMPFLLMVSLAALLMGILNSMGIFGVPAFAPMLLNLGMIAAGFLICPFFDPPIIGMAIGVILGGAGQFAFQIPSARRQGFKFKLNFDFKNPAFLQVIKLMIPMAIGYSATQINVFIVTRLAASLPEGSVSYLNYAFRLMHLPLGIFALAIATVSLPSISRFAAENDRANMAETYLKALRLGLYLVIPAQIVLIFGGEAIISVLFQHGRFTYADTMGAASALAFYSIGLVAFAVVRITVPVFYAFKQTSRPIFASLASVGVNITLCYLLKDSLGFKGLALAASIAGFVNLLILFILLKIKLPEIGWAGQIVPVLKIIAVNILLTGLVLLWESIGVFDLESAGLGLRIVNLVILVGGGAAIYLALSGIFRIGEMHRLLALFK